MVERLKSRNKQVSRDCPSHSYYAALFDALACESNHGTSLVKLYVGLLVDAMTDARPELTKPASGSFTFTEDTEPEQEEVPQPVPVSLEADPTPEEIECWRRDWMREKWSLSQKGNSYITLASGTNVVIYRSGNHIWGGRICYPDGEQFFMRRNYRTKDAVKIAAFEVLTWGKEPEAVKRK